MRHHATEGISVPLPPDWLPTGLAPASLLAFTEPWRPGRFAANVVVGLDTLADGETAPAWTDRVTAALPADLPRLRLVDVQDAVVDGRPARHLVAHYPAPDGGGVTVAQWLVPDGPRGIVLTCSVGTLEYDDAADLFAEIAAGVRLVEDGTDGDRG